MGEGSLSPSPLRRLWTPRPYGLRGGLDSMVPSVSSPRLFVSPAILGAGYQPPFTGGMLGAKFLSWMKLHDVQTTAAGPSAKRTTRWHSERAQMWIGGPFPSYI